MLVGTLVVLLAAALLQLGLVLHVRNLLADSAAEGARHGATLGASDSMAVDRTRELIIASLGEGYAHNITVRQVIVGGREVVQVDVAATLPLLGLLGPERGIVVSGRAIDEDSL